MTSKKILGITASVVILLVIFGVFIGTTDFLKEDSLPLETDKIPVYVPSDITKANPNILVGSGESSIRTTNISDVADGVFITVEGTVLEIGDPIHWFDSNFPNDNRGHGTVPVTISIEQVYKGKVDSDTFTFHINGMLRNWDLTLGEGIQNIPPEDRIFYLFPWEPQFEIGETVLLHINKAPMSSTAIIEKSDLDLLSQSPYSVQLGKYGKYQIHDAQAFNEKFTDGISLQTAISQSESP